MYKSLQACRGIAALLVVLFHLGGMVAMKKYFSAPEFDVLFSAGDAGVEFFFVLSGFIIFTAHRADMGEPSRLKSFVKKRIARIFPIYWIVFFVVYAAAMTSPALRNSVPHDPTLVLKSLLLLPQDPVQTGGTGAPVLFVAWTLQYEMLFYAFFALLILSRRAALFIAICFAVMYGGCAVTGTCTVFPLSFLYKDYVILFALGIGVALLADRLSIEKPLRLVQTGVALFVGVSADKVLHFDLLQNWKILLFGVASCLILLGLVIMEKDKHVMGGHRLLQLLGEASYSLYLIHVPAISLLLKFFVQMHLGDTGFLGSLLAYLLSLSGCLAIACFVHLWIEMPVTRKLRAWKR